MASLAETAVTEGVPLGVLIHVATLARDRYRDPTRPPDAPRPPTPTREKKWSWSPEARAAQSARARASHARAKRDSAMMPAWFRSLCRRIRATAPAANVTPPPPVTRTGPRPSPVEPDLEFVGTRDLFTAIESRYDACMIVCVRHTGGDDGSGSAVFLVHGVERPAAFLRSAAALAEEGRCRDLREGDL